MKIEHRTVTVGELVDGYFDNGEGGVVGYGGNLDIRPAYQREFVYDDKKRAAVIDTVMKGFPLNVMYWAQRADGTFEVMDGQQRTISLAQYATGAFSRDFRFMHNLTEDEQAAFLAYELTVYVCSGLDSEKLDWFRTINIAGERLTDQELRNAVYHGPWLADAKRYFSRTGCAAYQLGSDYVTGSPIRQDYLQTALTWVAGRDGSSIEGYMGVHQQDKNANDLWTYYQAVIAWVKLVFPVTRKEMKGLKWGDLYAAHSDDDLDGPTLEEDVRRLMADDDVTNRKGIYAYLLDGQERHLSIRAFTPSQRRAAYERQGGVCPVCGGTFTIDQMEADHITPWSKGGRTSAENCQMLCADDNRRKSNI